MDELGIMYFEVFRQVFAKQVADLLRDIQHKDKLGYKDVLATEIAPNPYLVSYLKETLPEQIATYRSQWDERRDLLIEFANNRDMGNTHMRDRDRRKHYEDLRRELVYREPDEVDGDWDHEEGPNDEYP